MTQIGSQQADGLGYRVGALFVKPDFLWRDVALRAELGAVRESLEAYDRDALTAGIGLDYRLSPQLTLGVGLAAELARITQDRVETRYNLVGVPLTLKWDTTGDLLDPKHGVRVVASVTPTQALGGTSGTFVVGRVTGSTYFDGSSWLGQEEGRTILATRLSLGTVVGAEAGALPPNRRFYAGGGGSVRGYAFQTIGPRTPSDKPAGGSSLIEASLELRQRFGENYGAVAFVDAGSVARENLPGGGDALAVGVGIGARYYTSFGPIRMDFAIPLDRRTGDSAWQLYVGIGQAF